MPMYAVTSKRVAPSADTDGSTVAGASDGRSLAGAAVSAGESGKVASPEFSTGTSPGIGSDIAASVSSGFGLRGARGFFGLGSVTTTGSAGASVTETDSTKEGALSFATTSDA